MHYIPSLPGAFFVCATVGGLSLNAAELPGFDSAQPSFDQDWSIERR